MMTAAVIILCVLAGTVVACALCAMNQLGDEIELSFAKERRRVRAGTCFTEEA